MAFSFGIYGSKVVIIEKDMEAEGEVDVGVSRYKKR